MRRQMITVALGLLCIPALGGAQTEQTVGAVPISDYLPVPSSVEEVRIPIDPQRGYWVGEVAEHTCNEMAPAPRRGDPQPRPCP